MGNEAGAVETFGEQAQAAALASARKNDSAVSKLACLSLPSFGLRHPAGHRRTLATQASAGPANC